MDFDRVGHDSTLGSNENLNSTLISDEISSNLIALDINTIQSNTPPTTNMVPANSLVTIRKRVPSDTTEDPGVIVWAPAVANEPKRNVQKKRFPSLSSKTFGRKSSIVCCFF